MVVWPDNGTAVGGGSRWQQLVCGVDAVGGVAAVGCGVVAVVLSAVILLT